MNRLRLPGPLVVRILLWLLIFAVFPLPTKAAAALSFRLEVLRCRTSAFSRQTQSAFSDTLVAALPPERVIVDQILRHLESAEAREPDPWLRDDIRIAWITVLEASRGNSQPHIDATYRVLGIHPDNVWPAICARRAALLGSESEQVCATPVVSIAALGMDSQDVAVIGAQTLPAGTNRNSRKKSTLKTMTKIRLSPPKKPCASVRGKKAA